MAEKNKGKSQLLKTSIAISLIITALSIAYYLIIFLPNKYKQEQSTKTFNTTSEMLDQSVRAKAIKGCTDEFITKAKDPDFAKTITAGAKDVGDITDAMEAYIKICMLKQGLEY